MQLGKRHPDSVYSQGLMQVLSVLGDGRGLDDEDVNLFHILIPNVRHVSIPMRVSVDVSSDCATIHVPTAFPSSTPCDEHDDEVEAAIGTVFPIRGSDLKVSMGQDVHKMVLRRVPRSCPINGYIADLFDKDDEEMGSVDVVAHSNYTLQLLNVFEIAPSIGKQWIGTSPSSFINTTQADVQRCLDGDCVAMCDDLHDLIEVGIHRLQHAWKNES